MKQISLVIAVYNAEKYLRRLLDSVVQQCAADLEVIIVDGGSKDQTINIIKDYDYLIAKYISEPDRGIYDAWNKGVKITTGEWIMFLGADDRLLPGAIQKYLSFIASSRDHQSLQYISSKIQMVDAAGNKIRVKGWAWKWPEFQKEMTVAHPGSLHSKSLFEKYGFFDISYKSSGDFELLLRAKGSLRTAFLNEITVEMQEGGMSDSIIGIREHCRAAIQTGHYPKPLAYLNAFWVFLKFQGKKGFRLIGVNAYLKRSNG